MCEGANEEKLMELLLDNNKLKITRDDLIGRRPYHIRGLDNPYIKSELRRYNKEVLIYRVGDKQSDKLEIPKDLKDIVYKKNIFKYCTKPELEILLIINEKKYKEFTKSKKNPKSFAKENIKFNKQNYDNSTSFYVNYYGGRRINFLVDNIKEYKKRKKHNSDELFLSELLK